MVLPLPMDLMPPDPVVDHPLPPLVLEVALVAVVVVLVVVEAAIRAAMETEIMVNNLAHLHHIIVLIVEVVVACHTVHLIS